MVLISGIYYRQYYIYTHTLQYTYICIIPFFCSKGDNVIFYNMASSGCAKAMPKTLIMLWNVA